jgi:hypothetical protein
MWERVLAKVLVVGSEGLLGFEESIAAYFQTKKVASDIKPWLNQPREIATISCLNGATVMEFLRHTVKLAGYGDEYEGYAAGADGMLKERNFPWWDNSLWLPVEFDNPSGLRDDPTYFIGSCQRLIVELDDMKRVSPLRLGEVAEAYFDMRDNFKKFTSSDQELNLLPEDCVRWVWKALKEGAEIAIANNAALWAGPD